MRVSHYAQRRKPFPSQIDYHSDRADFLGVLMIDGPEGLECQLAALLAKHYPRAVPEFGASD